MNSEEHVNAEGEATLWTRIIPEEILAKISGGKEVPAEKITVWIDPLDATQEYTGLVQLFTYKSYHINQLQIFQERSRRNKMMLFYLCRLSM